MAVDQTSADTALWNSGAAACQLSRYFKASISESQDSAAVTAAAVLGAGVAVLGVAVLGAGSAVLGAGSAVLGAGSAVLGAGAAVLFPAGADPPAPTAGGSLNSREGGGVLVRVSAQATTKASAIVDSRMHATLTLFSLRAGRLRASQGKRKCARASARERYEPAHSQRQKAWHSLHRP